MIAIDHHPRPVGASERRKLVDAVEHAPTAEHHLADEDEVVLAGWRPRETARESVERLDRDALDDRRSRFLPARELAPGTVEFAVGRQHSDRPARGGRREQTDKELMGVRRKDDRVGPAGTKLSRDFGLRSGPDLAHDLVPLAVGEAGRVVPRFDLSVEAGVGPEVMAVGREVQPVGIGAEASREQLFETQRSVLSAHSSGKTRFSSVARR